MQHDFRKQLTGEAADCFCSWLEQETTRSLREAYGNLKDTEAVIFLFVMRAYEAHMPEAQIGQTFGKCVVRAGYREQDQEAVFDWLEVFGQLAPKVYA